MQAVTEGKPQSHKGSQNIDIHVVGPDDTCHAAIYEVSGVARGVGLPHRRIEFYSGPDGSGGNWAQEGE